jgi:pyrimidine-specific ribonucleoside hydrolase
VVDTDPGIDDAFALALAASHPEARLLAVTTTFGNVGLDLTTGNAQRILGLLGRTEVVLGRGAARPLVHPPPESAADVHGADGLGGRAESIGPTGSPRPRPAQALLVEVLEAAVEPVVVLAIGPLTNLAVLLAGRPDLAERIGRIVVMGGAIAVPGNITPSAEFNVRSDPEAARRVLVEETVPVTLVPLDMTHLCTVDEAWLERLAATGPVAAALAGARETYLGHYQRALGARVLPMHDAVALLAALEPELFTCQTLPIEIDTSLGAGRGAVFADRRRGRPPYSGRPVDVALGADVVGVRAALFSALSSLPDRTSRVRVAGA